MFEVTERGEVEFSISAVELLETAGKIRNNYSAKALVDLALNSGCIYAEDLVKYYTDSNNLERDVIYNRVFSPERFSVQEFDKSHNYNGGYEFIPLGIYHFMNNYKVIKRELGIIPEKMSFIDVGCGTGNILFAAKYLLGFEQVAGIELSERLLYIADRILSCLDVPHYRVYGNELLKYNDHITMKRANAISFDYSGFNIINMYHPLEFDYEMIKLYKQVLETMDVGSIMVDHYRFDIIENITEIKFIYNHAPVGSTGGFVKKINEKTFELYYFDHF